MHKYISVIIRVPVSYTNFSFNTLIYYCYCVTFLYCSRKPINILTPLGRLQQVQDGFAHVKHLENMKLTVLKPLESWIMAMRMRRKEQYENFVNFKTPFLSTD